MRKLAVALSLFMLSSHAYALEVAGVSLPPTISAGQGILTLNGAGVRKKFLVKVYVGALYAERKVASADELMRDPGEKLVRMCFVYKKVEREKIVEGFAEGLERNAPDVANSADAKAFLSWFTRDFVAGDTVDIGFSPDGTVRVSQNGQVLGALRNPALARGVLGIWFGEKPADGALKKGMLGQG